MPDFDVIVVGLGAMGSATVYQLARRGQRVLGLDAFPAGHTLGSSHGETRIIRMAYFEHSDYVPLLRRAYALWDQTQRDAGVELLHLTGGLFIGPPDSDTVAGAQRSARLHGLPHEVLDAAQLRRRYPVLEARDDEVAFFEEAAGVVFPERCIAAHLRLAAAGGAALHHAQPVRTWQADSDGVRVQTDQATYTAGRLVLSAGAWMGKLAAGRGLPLLPLQAERIPIFWFVPRVDPDAFELGRLPIWIWDTGPRGNGTFFTTPHVDWPGVKIGKHHTQVACDPDTVDRQVSAQDEQPVREFLQSRVPSLAGPIADARVCLYTNTPDEHFIVDHDRNVVYACGFSGHGFKFASVIGEILADLATTGRATPEADFLRAARFSDRGNSDGASR